MCLSALKHFPFSILCRILFHKLRAGAEARLVEWPSLKHKPELMSWAVSGFLVYLCISSLSLVAAPPNTECPSAFPENHARRHTSDLPTMPLFLPVSDPASAGMCGPVWLTGELSLFLLNIIPVFTAEETEVWKKSANCPLLHSS